MANATTDHETIREWVEARGGSPARVKHTGILQIDFPGFSGQQSLESIEWDEFFAWFDENGLAFIYNDRAHGEESSRFTKLVARDTVAARDGRGAGDEQDAISLLTAQHRQVEQLLDQLRQLPPRSDDFRRTFDDLADALAVHSEIEERIFYPSVKTDDTEDLLEAAVEDHLQVKRVLANMLEAVADGDITGELEELGGLTEEHVIDEEYDLFPRVRQQMDVATLRQLAARMNEMSDELRRQGPPRLRVPEETAAAAPI
jgi:hemerythrin superfamily protein